MAKLVGCCPAGGRSGFESRLKRTDTFYVSPDVTVKHESAIFFNKKY